MNLTALRESVCEANLDLVAHGLVTLTWGNVSGYDPASQCVVIKPSGVDYDVLTPDRMAVVDLDGTLVEGQSHGNDLRPSSDTPTHVRLYREFLQRDLPIHGIAHTHATYATAFAQARRPISCLGTTHADHFMGEIPVARPLTPGEIDRGYEAATADVIVEAFERLNPVEIPAVLLAGHGPFSWGATPAAAVTNAVALEAVAEMALHTIALAGGHPKELERHVRDKHYQRKHGPQAYYGQPEEPNRQTQN